MIIFQMTVPHGYISFQLIFQSASPQLLYISYERYEHLTANSEVLKTSVNVGVLGEEQPRRKMTFICRK